MKLDTKSILKSLKQGSAESVKKLVESLPDSSMKDSTLIMAGKGNPVMDIVGLTNLVIKYCSGSDTEIGASLASALHTYALEIYQGGKGEGLLPTTLSNLASEFVKASNMLGRSSDVISFTNEYIPFYEKLGETQNLPSLKAGRIDALINLNRIDEAEQLLKDPKLRGNWATDLEILRLENKLRGLKADGTSMKPSSDVPPPPDKATGQAMIDALAGMLSDVIDDPKEKADLLAATKKLDPANRYNPNDPDQYRKMKEAMAQVNKYLKDKG